MNKIGNQNNIGAMNILQLPDCVLDCVMSYLSFDDIAKNRIVSKFVATFVLGIHKQRKYFISILDLPKV